MPPKGTNERRILNQSAPEPVQADPLDEHVSYVEFSTIFTTLANSIAAPNKWPATVLANPMENSATARIRDFTQINPPLFSGFKS